MKEDVSSVKSAVQGMAAAAAAAAKSLQSCLTLCHPIDGSPPGSLELPGKKSSGPQRNMFNFVCH